MAGAVCAFLAEHGYDVCTLTDEYRDQASSFMEALFVASRAIIVEWRQALDPFIWVVASVLALVPGTIALVKWRYYRRSQLVPRIEDFLAEEEERLADAKERSVRLGAREALRGSVGWRGPDRPIRYPIFAEPHLVKAMRQVGWLGSLTPVRLNSADQKIILALEKISVQKSLAVRFMEQHRRQEVTAYLLRGAIASSNASRMSNSAEAVAENRRALSFFRSAYEIDPTDKQAVEYSAHQHRVLGELAEALEAYRQLQEMARGLDAEDGRVLTRAWRYESEILEHQYELTGVRQRLVEARSKLEYARDNIALSAKDSLDHAAIMEVLGRVAAKLERFAVASRSYERAEALYSLLKENRDLLPEAKEGLARVQAALERLQQASTSGSEPSGGTVST